MFDAVVNRDFEAPRKITEALGRRWGREKEQREYVQASAAQGRNHARIRGREGLGKLGKHGYCLGFVKFAN